jgi:hypothetical protein
MNKSQLKQIIKEEIRKVLKENVTIDPALLNALKTALKSRIRYPEDEGAHDDMQMTLARIYKKAGLENPKELAAGNMEDEVTMTGPLRAVLELITATIEDEQSLTEEQDASGKGKLISALKKAGVDTKETVNVKLINKETGKEEIVTLDNGKFVDTPMEEGLKDKLLIGATCFILASGLISCNQDDSYNIGKDARYIMKPEILNTMGRKSFDSPANAKEKTYVWAGNQSGGRGTASRVLYHDYSNKDKNYGAVFGQNYPDSFAQGSNGITPTEVVKIIPMPAVGSYQLNDLIKMLTPYNKTKIDLTKYANRADTLGKTGTGNTKSSEWYIVIVEVHGSSHFDWADANNGQEIKDPKYKTGYAIYLVKSNIASGMKVGELYPTMLEVIYSFYNSRGEGTNSIKPFDDYFNNEFKALNTDKPSF